MSSKRIKLSPPTPAIQKKEVQRILSQTAKKGDKFFLISAKWWNQWKQHTQYAGDLPEGPEDAPEFIDNSDLVDEGSLIPNMIEGENYEVLPEEAWTLLTKWYGGGPAFARTIIEVGESHSLQVEVYLLSLEILSFSNEKSRQIQMSRSSTLYELSYEVTKRLPIAPQNAHIYIDITGEGEWKSIPFQDSKEQRMLSLDEVGVVDGTLLLATANPHSNINELLKFKSSLSVQRLPSLHYESDEDLMGLTEEEEMIIEDSRTHSKSTADKGVCGLMNLGNTCFMNSSLQCLSNTACLTNYFLRGEHEKDINRKNPIGMGGKLAEEYSKLLHKMWGGCSSVSPKEFKWAIGRFAPQFSDSRQHDSQELLAFLLDGLHEDLNRVKEKPYSLITEFKGSDERVAKLSWEAHLGRNRSIIVDLFQGQLKSTLVCPDPSCGNISITFDPFLYLSLPLPSTNARTINITFVPINEQNRKKIFQVKVDNSAKVGALKELLCQQIGASIVDPLDSVVLVDVYQKNIFHFIHNESLVSSIQQTDDIYAFQVLPTVSTHSPGMNIVHIQFVHRSPSNRLLGTPFILSLQVKRDDTLTLRDFFSQIELYLYTKKSSSGFLNDKFTVTDEAYNSFRPGETPNQLITVQHKSKWTIRWLEESFSTLPVESFDTDKMVEEERWKAQKNVSIFDCLRLFVKSEKLSKNDEWQCTKCKVKHQALKKFDLWKMPKILVIHLKRFQHDRWCRNKIDTMIDFPLQSLDLSDFVLSTEEKQSQKPIYDLFAVSVHSGGLGSGHYTAYGLNHCNQKWYFFNDAFVSPCDSSHVTKAGVYVLFYQRRDPPT